ncbi:MAG: hypothetical protein RMK18_07750 [Armatimonadota bacterium]|nr:hypothetical protein [Armatimonadota bacterium]
MDKEKKGKKEKGKVNKGRMSKVKVNRGKVSKVKMNRVKMNRVKMDKVKMDKVKMERAKTILKKKMRWMREQTAVRMKVAMEGKAILMVKVMVLSYWNCTQATTLI